jgi:hypothetical protein
MPSATTIAAKPDPSLVLPKIIPPGFAQLDAAAQAWHAKMAELSETDTAADARPRDPAAATSPPPTTRATVMKLDFIVPLINARKYRDAEQKLLESYVAVSQDALDPAQLQAICSGLIRVYDAWGMKDKARVFREKREGNAAKSDLEIELLDTMNKLAYSWRLQQRFGEACSMREKVVARAAKILPAADKRLIQFRVDYADLLIQTQDYARAEEQLLAGEQALKDSPENPQAQTLRRSLARVRGLRSQASTQPAASRPASTPAAQ